MCACMHDYIHECMYACMQARMHTYIWGVCPGRLCPTLGQLVRAVILHEFNPHLMQLLCRYLEQVMCAQLLGNTAASASPRHVHL